MNLATIIQARAVKTSRKALAAILCVTLCVSWLPAEDSAPRPNEPRMPECKNSDNDCAALGRYATELQLQADKAQQQADQEVSTLLKEAEYWYAKAKTSVLKDASARGDAALAKAKAVREAADNLTKAADKAMARFRACLRLPPCGNGQSVPTPGGFTFDSCPGARSALNTAKSYHEMADRQRQEAAKEAAAGRKLSASLYEQRAADYESSARVWEREAALALLECNERRTIEKRPEKSDTPPSTAKPGLMPEPPATTPRPSLPPASQPGTPKDSRSIGKPAALPDDSDDPGIPLDLKRPDGKAPEGSKSKSSYPPADSETGKTTLDSTPLDFGQAIWEPVERRQPQNAPVTGNVTLTAVHPAGATDNFTGIIVEDARKYANNPELELTPIEVASDGPLDGTFTGTAVQTPDGKWKPLTKEVLLTLPRTVPIVFGKSGNPGQPASTVGISELPTEHSTPALSTMRSTTTPTPTLTPTTYTTPAAITSAVQKIAGPIPADTSVAHAALNGEPALVIASQDRGPYRVTYVDVSNAPPGRNELELNGAQMTLQKYTLSVSGPKVLPRGQTGLVTITANYLPDSGFLRVKVTNQTPNVKLHGARGNEVVLTLDRAESSRSLEITGQGQGEYRLAYSAEPNFPPVSVKVREKIARFNNAAH